MVSFCSWAFKPPKQLEREGGNEGGLVAAKKQSYGWKIAARREVGAV